MTAAYATNNEIDVENSSKKHNFPTMRNFAYLSLFLAINTSA